VPTCRTSERVTEVRARLGGDGRRGCVVVNERRVVLGDPTPERLEGDGLAGEAMDPAPTTIRPSASPKEILELMGEAARS
jgi:CBS domain-containing protein